MGGFARRGAAACKGTWIYGDRFDHTGTRIGATTAIFTLVHQVMLKSVPLTKPGELWRIADKDPAQLGGYTQGEDGDFALFTWEAYQHFREHTPEFKDLAASHCPYSSLNVHRVSVSGRSTSWCDVV